MVIKADQTKCIDWYISQATDLYLGTCTTCDLAIGV